MMETLIRARPFVVTAFFASLIATITAPLWWHQLLVPAAIGAHVALLFFLATESFGRVSRTRGNASRVIARVCFAFSSLLVTWMVLSGLAVLFA